MIKCPKYKSVKEFFEHASFYDGGGNVTTRYISKKEKDAQELFNSKHSPEQHTLRPDAKVILTNNKNGD